MMGKKISFRVSDEEYELIERLRGNKTVTQFFIDLLHWAEKGEREDLKGWSELVERIEKVSSTNLDEKLELIYRLLVDLDVPKVYKYLKRILYYGVRGSIAVEEYARRVVKDYQRYIDDIERRIEEKQIEEKQRQE